MTTQATTSKAAQVKPRTQTPDNHCPICGSNNITRICTDPDEPTQWIHACSTCDMSWQTFAWEHIMEFNTQHNIPYLDKTKYRTDALTALEKFFTDKLTERYEQT